MAYRGKNLKALREARQIRLRRIANETRIGMTYLDDLENERFDRFPGEFYFKSFTREYARSLGLNPDEVLNDLQPAYDAWSGKDQCNGDLPEATPAESGLLHRIAGYFRGFQEV